MLLEKGADDQLNRNSYEPAYAQLVRIFRRKIASGEFRPGDRLPSEAQVCRNFSVSPMTVRRVVNILAEQGVITTEQGRGTFVKPLELGTASFQLNEFLSIFEETDTTEIKILDARIVPADKKTGSKLGVNTGEKIIYIHHLITREGSPALYHREYLVYDPERPIVEAEMETTSLRGLLEGTGGMVLKNGSLTIAAVILSEEEAEILSSTPGTAALSLEHVFHDFDNKPVSWGWFVSPGDRLQFTTTVGIQDTY